MPEEYEGVAQEVEEQDDDALFPEVEEDAGTGEEDTSASAQQLEQLSNRMTDGELSDEEIAAQVEQVEALARSFPAVKDMPEYKNFLDTVNQVRDAGDDDKGAEAKEETETVDSKQPKAEAEEQVQGDPFGLTKKKAKADPIGFDVNDEFKEHIKSNYAIDDPDTFFNSVNTWRNDSQELAKTTEQHEDLLEGINALPQAIKDAITAFTKAEDYHEAFMSSGGRLNYELEFSDQGKEAVVKHYFADKFGKIQSKLDDGNIDEDDYEDRLELLHESAERLYKADQKVFEQQRAEIQQEQQQLVERMHNSALSSVDSLKKTYSDFSKADLQRVRQRLVNGDIESLFYDDDGGYKEDAAEMLAFAMYGKEVVSTLLEQAKLQGESEANKKIVKRGDKSVKSRKSTEKAAQKEAIDAIGHLDQEFKPDPYA